MTHEDTTISDLVKHFRLKDAWLEKAIDQTDIGKLTDKRDLTSEFSVSKWKKWAKKLGIVLEGSDTDDSGVTEQGAKGDIYRCQKILEMWKQKCGSIRPATFKKLAQVFLDGQNTFLAEQVCNYVQVVAGGAKETERIMTSCGRCKRLQVSNFEELKSNLTTFKKLSLWSNEKKSQEMMMAIRKYMNESMEAGCDDPQHLLEHVNDLCQTEMLFTDHKLYLEVQKIAKDHKPESHPPGQTEQSRAMDTSKSIDQPAELDLYSKHTLYQASICCQFIKEQECKEIPILVQKKTLVKEEKIYHEFKEMSLSDNGQYLIAKESNNSIYYIAFNAELELSTWPKESHEKDITDALHQHLDNFQLVKFIEELLTNEKRVILTGFSSGGILACSMLVKIRRHCSISLQKLQKNLACITFGQPHLPVPELQETSCVNPEIAKAIHVVISEDDVLPRILGVLYYTMKCKRLKTFCESLQFLYQKDPEKVEKMRKMCSIAPVELESPKAVPGINQEMTYHLFTKGSEVVHREKLEEQRLYELHQVNEVFIEPQTKWMSKVTDYCAMIRNFVQRGGEYELSTNKSTPTPVTEVRPEIARIELHKYGPEAQEEENSEPSTQILKQKVEGEYELSTNKSTPTPVTEVRPEIARIESHKYGPEAQEEENSEEKNSEPSTQILKQEVELILAIEGKNLWFISEVELKPEVEYKEKSKQISGSSVRINISSENNNALAALKNEAELEVKLRTAFDMCNASLTHSVKVYTKEYITSKRQQQLAKLTPSQVIEVSYLCALLEKQLIAGTDRSSKRVKAIETFLNEVIHVVPIESLGFSIANAEPSIRGKCVKALQIKLPSSKMMSDALQQATNACSCIKSLKSQSCSFCSTLKRHCTNMKEISSTICGWDIEELYPNEFEIMTPIEVLKSARKELNKLSKKERTECNNRMLSTVKKIRTEELAMCISLLGSFMVKQEISIPLIETNTLPSPKNSGKNSEFSLYGSMSIGVWALSSFKLDRITEIMKHTQNKQLLVNVSNDTPYESNKDTQQQQDQEKQESCYNSKLKFIVGSLNDVVACNSQYVGYSLERQLLEYCKRASLMEIDPVTIAKNWDTLFKQNTLKLVAESHRPLIARWLKWSLMVHNLREELAKYTTIGVVGLVNSGKSTLLNSLFPRLKIPTGTFASGRTTIPFIYSVSDYVDGLEVVDFPGVDDVDKSIGELADLLLNLAQIVVFVVEYKRAHTTSCKDWLKRLAKEEVPVLVCLTHADELYKELYRKHKKDNQSFPSEKYMQDKIQEELSDKRSKLEEPPNESCTKLEIPESWKFEFYTFSQTLSTDLYPIPKELMHTEKEKEIREKLKNVGIYSPLDVGAWLVDTFKWRFFQQKMATKLQDHLKQS